MYYSETKEKTGEYLRLALNQMMQHGVPANPVNYTVWYEYVTGNNAKLTSAIDYSKKQAKPLNDQLHKHLYQRYIVDDDRLASHQMLKETVEIISTLSREVGSSGGEMANRGNALEAYATQLEEDPDMGGVNRLIACIITETKMMVESGKALKKRLDTSTREISELREKLKKSKAEAVTDALTGLANRRGFEEAAHHVLRQATSCPNGISLIMADIDHFKRINDTFGHLVGDNVIKMFATTIKDYVKGRDIVARFGGEEYVILLPDTSVADAAKLGEKIRQFLHNMKWKRKDTGLSLGAITLSLGVAGYRPGEHLDTLIKRADQALYFSKENGRNQVSTETVLHARAS